MCGRYSICTEDELIEIKSIIEEISIRISDEGKKYFGKVVAPTCIAPVITNDYQMILLKWGFTKWDQKGVIFNTKIETLDKSKFYQGLSYRRCLIPIKCYYEWEHKDQDKIKYQISLKDEQTFLAGIYHQEEDSSYTFSILTQDAINNISFIHQRMPVIISNKKIDEWLNDKNETISFIYNESNIEYKSVL